MAVDEWNDIYYTLSYTNMPDTYKALRGLTKPITFAIHLPQVLHYVETLTSIPSFRFSNYVGVCMVKVYPVGKYSRPSIFDANNARA